MFTQKSRYLRVCCKRSFTCNGCRYSAQALTKEDAKSIIQQQLKAEVTPPPAKRWSKTAVLKALRSTMKVAFVPQYHCIGSSQYWHHMKRDGRKAKALRSGEIAADYVMQKQTDVFKHNWNAADSEPWLKMIEDSEIVPEITAEEVEAFQSPQQDFATLENSAESLQILIDNKKPDAAAAMYVRLHKQGVPVGEVILNKLLGFLALYRNDLDVKELEKNDVQVLYTSKQKSLDLTNIFSVYETIPEPSIDQNAIMIKALTLNRNDVNCFEFYTEKFAKRNITPDLETFNHLIKSKPSNMVDYKTGLIWLKKIAQAGLQPNHDTFHKFLFLRTPWNIRATKTLWSQTLGEMKRLGLPLTPTVFYNMLYAINKRIAEKDTQELTNWILDQMQEKDLILATLNDGTSYLHLLRKVRDDYSSVKKVWNAFTYNQNSLFVPVSHYFDEIFFNTYLEAVIKNDTIDVAFETFQKFIPVRIIAKSSNVDLMLLSITRSKRPEFLPIFYALFCMDVLGKVRWSACALKLLDEADEELQGQFAQIALHSFQRKAIFESPQTVCECLEIVSRCGTIDEVLKAISAAARFRKHVTPNTVKNCIDSLQRFPPSNDITQAISKLQKLLEKNTEVRGKHRYA